MKIIDFVQSENEYTWLKLRNGESITTVTIEYYKSIKIGMSVMFLSDDEITVGTKRDPYGAVLKIQEMNSDKPIVEEQETIEKVRKYKDDGTKFKRRNNNRSFKRSA